jgi:hypothetical protein
MMLNEATVGEGWPMGVSRRQIHRPLEWAGLQNTPETLVGSIGIRAILSQATGATAF